MAKRPLLMLKLARHSSTWPWNTISILKGPVVGSWPALHAIQFLSPAPLKSCPKNERRKMTCLIWPGALLKRLGYAARSKWRTTWKTLKYMSQRRMMLDFFCPWSRRKEATGHWPLVQRNGILRQNQVLWSFVCCGLVPEHTTASGKRGRVMIQCSW